MPRDQFVDSAGSRTADRRIWTTPAVLAVVLTALALGLFSWFWVGLNLMGTSECNPGVNPDEYSGCRSGALQTAATLTFCSLALVVVLPLLGAWMGRRRCWLWLGHWTGVVVVLGMLVVVTVVAG